MRSFIVAAFLLPLAAQAAFAASNPFTAPKTIKIKEEIVSRCGNFPYAPTLAIDAKTATIVDMRRARRAVEQYVSEVSYYEKCLLALDRAIGPSMSQSDSTYVVKVFNRAQEERDVLSLDFNKLVDDYDAANGIKKDPPKAAKGAKPATGKTPAATATPATGKTPAAVTTTPAAKAKPATTKTP